MSEVIDLTDEPQEIKKKDGHFHRKKDRDIKKDRDMSRSRSRHRNNKHNMYHNNKYQSHNNNNNRNWGTNVNNNRHNNDININNIPLIPWKLRVNSNPNAPKSVQNIKLLNKSFNTNDYAMVHKLLILYQDKTDKYWIGQMRRSLHAYKPPEYDFSVWSKFHTLFTDNIPINSTEYASAFVIILPVLANYDFQKSYKIFQLLTNDTCNNWNPNIRIISILLQICCKQIQQNNEQERKRA
eukprot:389681_1